jgi:glycerol-3-phosphate dehydrogenase subunit C
MNPLFSSNFESCTKCTICTEYCPVSEVRPSFLGPKQSGPDGERQRLKDAVFYDEALKYCTNCKRCETACPSNVRIGDIIALARKKLAKSNYSLRDFILSHTDLMGSLSSTIAPLVNLGVAWGPAKYLLEKVLGIPSWRTFPAYSWGTFRRLFATEVPDQSSFKESVTLFHGCFVNYNNPSLGLDAVRVLNALGVGVSLMKSERCCGVPLIASGFFSDARLNACANQKSIEKAIAETGRVVAPSSTCVMTVRDEYPDILKVDNSLWRDRFELLTRHIYRLFESGRTLEYKTVDQTVAYHTACHIEKLGWSAYSIEILKQIPGLKVVLLPSRCCGIAGTYGFKLENSETSQRIGAPLFKDITESRASLVVSECETCKMQIEMSTGIPCENPVTVLARALKLSR